MKKTVVFLNESHSLMSEQSEILTKKFGEFEIISVPTNGWNLDEMKAVEKQFASSSSKPANVIFASPIPYLLSSLSRWQGYGKAGEEMGVGLVGCGLNIFVFHNDNRQKRELPNGKIIFTVSETGWQLV